MICLLGNDHFNIPTRFLTTTLNLHIFIDVIKLNQTFIFQRYTTHFLRKAQILCFFLVIFIWLGHSFSFSTRISIYITASNIEMFVNLTFDRKYEKSTQKECMWTCLHYKMSFIFFHNDWAALKRINIAFFNIKNDDSRTADTSM